MYANTLSRLCFIVKGMDLSTGYIRLGAVTIQLMNPQQPQYQVPQAPQPPQHNPGDPNDPYAFIMNNGVPQPTGKFNLPKGNSTLQRALIFGGGFLLLIIVGSMALSVLSGGNGHNEQLLTLAQEQTEIVRIADLAQNERAVRSSTTQNLASSTSLSVNTSKLQTLALIKGKKPGEKTLGLKHSSKTDSLLTDAASNNEYDQVFTDTLTTKLKAYQGDIKKLYAGNKSQKEKAVLETAYNGTVILLGENK
jgi:hypothetical protein